MKVYTSGESATVFIELTWDGEFVVPDEGSVSYIVRSNNGTILVSSTPLVTTSATTALTITVPAEHNIASDLENRFVIVTFTVGGRPHRISHTYQVSPWYAITASEDQVRAELGVSKIELPDEAIDLSWAFMDLRVDLGEPLLTALVSNGRINAAANKAMVYRASLEVIPSLQLRINQSEKSDDVSASRMARIDFEKLKNDISAKLTEMKAIISGIDQSVLPLLVLSTPTDVITGA